VHDKKSFIRFLGLAKCAAIFAMDDTGGIVRDRKRERGRERGREGGRERE